MWRNGEKKWGDCSPDVEEWGEVCSPDAEEWGEEVGGKCGETETVTSF